MTCCEDTLLLGCGASLRWVRGRKDAPDGAGRAWGSRADSPLSKETDITDATKLFCWVAKIHIFIHYADPSDGDPCPRRSDILYEASSACVQPNWISPASASTQSIQSTSSGSRRDKITGRVLKWDLVTNTTETHAEVKCMHRTGVNKSCWPAHQDVLCLAWLDLPASEATDNSLYGKWKVGLAPARESASEERSDKFGFTHRDIRIHAYMTWFLLLRFAFFLLCSVLLHCYFFLKKRKYEA